MLPSTDVSRDESRGAGPDRAEVVVALAAIALGLFVFFASFSIDLGTGYDRIGPRFFPYVVAAGLVLSGSFLARGALRRPNPSPTEFHLQTSWPAIGTLALALGSSVLLLERAGFILTAALLFFLVARAFESRRPWRDAVVGLLLSVFVYVAFTRGLGLVLPHGLL
ncbi:MAG: tripartite tricarboxylate transporter TctB family protein [Vicinamibacteria bacterium]|nr:tripartite tricarboxylate transporter TctB family protein [Vicinamibacteria bacterium]